MVEYDAAVKQFEEMGETKVRAAIANNAFGEARKRMAQDWLAARADSRKEASHRDSNQIARSAKNAAWAAAIAAIIAAIAAIISIVMNLSVGAPTNGAVF